MHGGGGQCVFVLCVCTCARGRRRPRRWMTAAAAGWVVIASLASSSSSSVARVRMLWAGSRAPRAVQAAALGNIIYYFKQTKNQKNWALSRGAVCCGPVAHQHALQECALAPGLWAPWRCCGARCRRNGARTHQEDAELLLRALSYPPPRAP